jgi:hypothetical protein
MFGHLQSRTFILTWAGNNTPVLELVTLSGRTGKGPFAVPSIGKSLDLCLASSKCTYLNTLQEAPELSDD